eukprot:jgi/Ulvmu1/6123/UM027_0101.1
MGDWSMTRAQQTRGLAGIGQGSFRWNDWPEAASSRVQVPPGGPSFCPPTSVIQSELPGDTVRLSPPPPLDVSSQLAGLPQRAAHPRASHTRSPYNRGYSGMSQRPLQQSPQRPFSPTDPLQLPHVPPSHPPFPPGRPKPPDAALHSSGAASAAASAPKTLGGETSYPLPPYTPAVRQQISRHQRMLLFLRHCAKCTDPVSCRYSWRCESGKELWQHIFSCSNPRCTFQNCVQARELLRHYQKCHDPGCPICGPVREFLASPQGQAGGLPQNMV